MALEYPILVQGTAPRSQLLKQFRDTPHAVLFATSSFWQGVDVVGEALSCVIVDKLPFASPGDPITSARIDAIRARGGEPFSEYQVPLAILTLQQGLGRLIRHRGDRGVLAVLDPRLRTKGYGRRFVASPAAGAGRLRAFSGRSVLSDRVRYFGTLLSKAFDSGGNMVRRVNGRPAWLVVFLVLAAVALAVPAFAQNGMVKGTVRDEKGQPVDGAKVSIAQNGGTGRKFETKSDKKGEFIQIGLPSGQYAVTAEKDKLASPPSTVGVSVGTPG